MPNIIIAEGHHTNSTRYPRPHALRRGEQVVGTYIELIHNQPRPRLFLCGERERERSGDRLSLTVPNLQDVNYCMFRNNQRRSVAVSNRMAGWGGEYLVGGRVANLAGETQNLHAFDII